MDFLGSNKVYSVVILVSRCYTVSHRSYGFLRWFSNKRKTITIIVAKPIGKNRVETKQELTGKQASSGFRCRMRSEVCR
jgi:hypothetical protein